MKDPRKFWSSTSILTLSVMTVIFLWPMPEGGPASSFKEAIAKFIHFTAYAILTYVGVRLCRAYQWPVHHLLASGTFALTYGAVIEILQRFVPRRTPSWEDEMFNALGVFTMILIMARFSISSREPLVKAREAGVKF